MNLKVFYNKLFFPLLIAGLSQVISAQPIRAQRSPDDLVNVTIQSIMRQCYEAMQQELGINLRVARELEAEVSRSASEIGLLLLQTRDDVVIKLSDSHIGVRTAERIYPNNSLTSSTDRAELLIDGRCNQGRCSQIRYDGKTLLYDEHNEQIYAIDTSIRFSSDGFTPIRPQDRVFGNSRRSYVRCSRTQPAYIFQSMNSGEFYSTSLNPGENPAGFAQEATVLYWVTCHNIVGPNFFGEDMRQRAIDLGYPLNLRLNQTSSDSLEDLL
jgi:hypothetical protein